MEHENRCGVVRPTGGDSNEADTEAKVDVFTAAAAAAAAATEKGCETTGEEREKLDGSSNNTVKKAIEIADSRQFGPCYCTDCGGFGREIVCLENYYPHAAATAITATTNNDDAGAVVLMHGCCSCSDCGGLFREIPCFWESQSFQKHNQVVTLPTRSVVAAAAAVAATAVKPAQADKRGGGKSKRGRRRRKRSGASQSSESGDNNNTAILHNVTTSATDTTTFAAVLPTSLIPSQHQHQPQQQRQQQQQQQRQQQQQQQPKTIPNHNPIAPTSYSHQPVSFTLREQQQLLAELRQERTTRAVAVAEASSAQAEVSRLRRQLAAQSMTTKSTNGGSTSKLDKLLASLKVTNNNRGAKVSLVTKNTASAASAATATATATSTAAATTAINTTTTSTSSSSSSSFSISDGPGRGGGGMGILGAAERALIGQRLQAASQLADGVASGVRLAVQQLVREKTTLGVDQTRITSTSTSTSSSTSSSTISTGNVAGSAGRRYHFAGGFGGPWSGMGSAVLYHVEQAAAAALPVCVSALQSQLPGDALVLEGASAWNAYLCTPLLTEDLDFVALVPADKLKLLAEAMSIARDTCLGDPTVARALATLEDVIGLGPQPLLGEHSAEDKHTHLESVHKVEASPRATPGAGARHLRITRNDAGGYRLQLHRRTLIDLRPASSDAVALLEQYGTRTVDLAHVLRGCCRSHRGSPNMSLSSTSTSSSSSSSLSSSSSTAAAAAAAATGGGDDRSDGTRGALSGIRLSVAPVPLLQHGLRLCLESALPWRAEKDAVRLRHLSSEALLAYEAVGSKFGGNSGSGSSNKDFLLMGDMATNLSGWDNLLAYYDPAWLAVSLCRRRAIDGSRQLAADLHALRDGINGNNSTDNRIITTAAVAATNAAANATATDKYKSAAV